MNLKLKQPTLEQLRSVYNRDLSVSFPPAELKPLWAIAMHMDEGRYRPWCLFDGNEILGEAFLWLGNPGWALLDYLCITSQARNAGLGSTLIRMLRDTEQATVILAETEVPKWAPNPKLAARRHDFYQRNGAKFASFQSEIFGVPYDLLYWSEDTISTDSLQMHYRTVYRQSFCPEKYEKYVQIPRKPGNPSLAQPWDE